MSYMILMYVLEAEELHTYVMKKNAKKHMSKSVYLMKKANTSIYSINMYLHSINVNGIMRLKTTRVYKHIKNKNKHYEFTYSIT